MKRSAHRLLQRDGDESERQFVESAGMKFYRIPMTTHEPPATETLARFLQLVNDPANLPVYVHCNGYRADPDRTAPIPPVVATHAPR